MNENIHLEYKSSLKKDYAENYIEIIYDSIKKKYIKIYLYSWKYGTIDLNNGKKEIHKWETEDDSKTGSYLNRNYPIICLNGETKDENIEDGIIEENIKYINTLIIDNDKKIIINNAIKYLKKIKS